MFVSVCGFLIQSLSQIAVPAPTDLNFGKVGPDSMEVTWAPPHTPDNNEITSFVIR